MMKRIMKSVATIAIAASIGVGTATAQACEETQFSSTNARSCKRETQERSSVDSFCIRICFVPCCNRRQTFKKDWMFICSICREQ